MKARNVLIGLTVTALAMVVLLAPFASPFPDGLEQVAENLGFSERAENTPPTIVSPLPDYLFPGIRDERIATVAAGLLGIVVVGIIGVVLARLIIRKRSDDGTRLS